MILRTDRSVDQSVDGPHSFYKGKLYLKNPLDVFARLEGQSMFFDSLGFQRALRAGKGSKGISVIISIILYIVLS